MYKLSRQVVFLCIICNLVLLCSAGPAWTTLPNNDPGGTDSVMFAIGSAELDMYNLHFNGIISIRRKIYFFIGYLYVYHRVIFLAASIETGGATIILDMTDPELEMCATHLGHPVKTHKENYRLTHSTRELTKVSQLLAVENRQVNSWKGKPLSEISHDELPAVEDVLHREDVLFQPISDEEGLDGSSSVVQVGPHVVQSGPHRRITGKNNTCRKKRPWTEEENECLQKKFKFYFAGLKKTIHNADMDDAQKICPSLLRRTKARIRSKVNNMKLGKSKLKICRVFCTTCDFINMYVIYSQHLTLKYLPSSHSTMIILFRYGRTVM